MYGPASFYVKTRPKFTKTPELQSITAISSNPKKKKLQYLTKRSAQTIVHMISAFYYRKIKPTFSHLGYKHMTFLCFINTDIILANPHSIFGI